MFRNAIVGLVIVNAALMMPLASAASTPYAVDIGDTKSYVVPGSSHTLNQMAGTATSWEEPDAPGFIKVFVHCLDTSAVNCLGTIESS